MAGNMLRKLIDAQRHGGKLRSVPRKIAGKKVVVSLGLNSMACVIDDYSVPFFNGIDEGIHLRSQRIEELVQNSSYFEPGLVKGVDDIVGVMHRSIESW